MAFMLGFSSKAVKKAFGKWLARQGPLASLNSKGASSVMGKGSRLADRSHYGDGTRIIRSRIGARAAARPIAKAITGGWRCTDGDICATGSPAAIGTYLAACPSVHRQVILGAEFSRVSLVRGWGNAM